MNENLQKIQKRYDEYKSEYEKVLVNFHDTDTLNYFNERFGYDNPRADEVNWGIRIERDIIEMEKELEEFAESFCKRFPSTEN